MLMHFPVDRVTYGTRVSENELWMSLKSLLPSALLSALLLNIHHSESAHFTRKQKHKLISVLQRDFEPPFLLICGEWQHCRASKGCPLPELFNI